MASLGTTIIIVSLQKKQFQQLYNSIQDDVSKNEFKMRVAISNEEGNSLSITLYEVNHAINNQKKATVTGPDGVNMEAFIYGGNILAQHICNILNLCLKHSHMPSTCMQANIVPLVKCKSGNLTDMNNYRAITSYNAVTKMLEFVFLDK